MLHCIVPNGSPTNIEKQKCLNMCKAEFKTSNNKVNDNKYHKNIYFLFKFQITKMKHTFALEQSYGLRRCAIATVK